MGLHQRTLNVYSIECRSITIFTRSWISAMGTLAQTFVTVCMATTCTTYVMLAYIIEKLLWEYSLDKLRLLFSHYSN